MKSTTTSTAKTGNDNKLTRTSKFFAMTKEAEDMVIDIILVNSTLVYALFDCGVCRSLILLKLAVSLHVELEKFSKPFCASIPSGLELVSSTRCASCSMIVVVP